MPKKKTRSRKKGLFRKKLKFGIWSLFLIIVSYIIFFYSSEYSPIELYALHKVERNYGLEIEKAAHEFNLPASYMKALAMLECSGDKNLPSRYEKHIYERLKLVKSGKRKKYESLTNRMVRSVSDDALKNLATSWGPFQIMGYKCVQLGIFVHHLRGKEAVHWGAKWIKLNYGDLLREGRFKDAFHFHNTGRIFPKDGKSMTHDPLYVSKGLHYMNYFE